jgi:MFS family permease
MPAGQLIDSVGPIKMLKFGSIFLILSLFFNMMATDFWLLSLSQIFMGLCIIIMASSFQVLVSDGEKNARNENIKKFSMWMSAGGMLGPLIGGSLTSRFSNPLFGFKFTFGAACTASLLFFILLLVVSRGYQHKGNESLIKPKELLKVKGIMDSYISGIHLTKIRSVQFGLIGTFLIMYIQSMYMSFMPLYLNQLGYSTLIVSLVISLNGLSGMLSRFGLGWLMKRTHMERILITAGLIASICVVLTPLAGLHLSGMILLVLVMGGSVGINLPVSIMIVVNDTKEADRGKLMGLRLIINRFSQILSPAMFGILGQSFGLTAAFYAGGGFLIASMLGFSLFTSMKWKLKTVGIDPKEKAKKENLTLPIPQKKPSPK